jgi:hypothetical protein
MRGNYLVSKNPRSKGRLRPEKEGRGMMAERQT